MHHSTQSFHGTPGAALGPGAAPAAPPQFLTNGALQQQHAAMQQAAGYQQPGTQYPGYQRPGTLGHAGLQTGQMTGPPKTLSGFSTTLMSCCGTGCNSCLVCVVGAVCPAIIYGWARPCEGCDLHHAAVLCNATGRNKPCHEVWRTQAAAKYLPDTQGQLQPHPRLWLHAALLPVPVLRRAVRLPLRGHHAAAAATEVRAERGAVQRLLCALLVSGADSFWQGSNTRPPVAWCTFPSVC